LVALGISGFLVAELENIEIVWPMGVKYRSTVQARNQKETWDILEDLRIGNIE
jgi:hypothetical protein